MDISRNSQWSQKPWQRQVLVIRVTSSSSRLTIQTRQLNNNIQNKCSNNNDHRQPLQEDLYHPTTKQQYLSTKLAHPSVLISVRTSRAPQGTQSTTVLRKLWEAGSIGLKKRPRYGVEWLPDGAHQRGGAVRQHPATKQSTEPGCAASENLSR